MVSVDFTLLIQWLNFGVLLLILYWILYRPLIKFLDERNAKLKADIDGAKANREETDRLKREYEDRIAQLKLESFRYVEEASKRAEEERKLILEKAHEEAEKVLQSSRREMRLSAERIRLEMKQDVAGLVVECAKRVIGREVKEEDHRQLIGSFLEEEAKRG